MSFNDFSDIYRFTNPRDITGAFVSEASQQGNPELRKRTLLDTLTTKLVDPSGGFSSFSDIKQSIDDFFAGRTPEEKSVAKDVAKYKIHAISNKEQIDFGDENYYFAKNPDPNGQSAAGEMSGKAFLPGVLPAGVTDRVCAAFATRSPHLTPAKRGTEAIEFFLNYTPSVMAMRLIPFLSIEMELETQDDPREAITTPNVLRFLVGSGEIKDLPLTEADKALIQSDFGPEENQPAKAFTGMEMFLLPQSLTNMDTLGASANRLVPVKPFVPFASVESFTVSLVNAGSGAMVHKKGSLKLKVHDKARLVEISQFIRGPVGYKQATIWTTYGHICPRTTESEFDSYAKFVNENMHTVDCWMVANSQYSFDLNGQATISIELVSKGIVSLQNSRVAIGSDDGGLSDYQKDLQNAMSVITEVRLKLAGPNPQGEEIRVTQILNQASQGLWPEEENAGQALRNLMSSLRKGSRILDPETLKKLEDSLNFVQTYGATAAMAAASSVEERIRQICTRGQGKLADHFQRWPWLENTNMNDDEKKEYAPRALYDIIQSHDDSSYGQTKETIAKMEVKEKEKAILSKGGLLSLDFSSLYASRSFGHLFMQLVAPAMLKDGTCNELQVIFYGLNDSCGPVSGLSIAEFPIDMISFSHALRDVLKTGTDGASLTVPRFLQVLVESQFNDNRALGYGMSKAYKAYNPYKSEAEKVDEKEYESVMAQWFADYGSLQRPVIEMYMETGKANSRKIDIHEKLQKSRYTMSLEQQASTTAANDRDPNWVIKRIHIYDKTNTPYKLTQDVFRTNDGYIFGHVDKTKQTELARQAMGQDLAQFDDAMAAAASKKAKDDAGKVAKATPILGKASDYQASLAAKLSAGDGKDYNSLVVNEFGSNFVVSNKSAMSTKDSITIRNVVKHMAPNIILGANGSLVKAAALSSKTDGLMGSINIINANKTQEGGAQGGTEAPRTGLENPNGLPLRVTPAQLQMSTFGCAIAQLYQQYFIDFGTGTTIDNLYNCTQISHNMSPGKFETSWTFVYTDGYGKFTGAPTIDTLAGQAINSELAALRAESERAQERIKKKAQEAAAAAAAAKAAKEKEEASPEGGTPNPDAPGAGTYNNAADAAGG